MQGYGANHLDGLIARVVIDEDSFPFDPGERPVKAVHQRDDIVDLVECRDYDR